MDYVSIPGRYPFGYCCNGKVELLGTEVLKMLINAIYDHGQIIWPDNLKLKDEKIPIVVDVPDEDINTTVDVNSVYEIKNSFLKEKLAKLESIRHYKTPYLADDISDRELLIEGIKMKYGNKD